MLTKTINPCVGLHCLRNPKMYTQASILVPAPILLPHPLNLSPLASATGMVPSTPALPPMWYPKTALDQIRMRSHLALDRRSAAPIGRPCYVSAMTNSGSPTCPSVLVNVSNSRIYNSPWCPSSSSATTTWSYCSSVTRSAEEDLCMAPLDDTTVEHANLFDPDDVKPIVTRTRKRT